MVTLDLGTVGYYNELVLFNTLNSALNKGEIAQYSVSPKGFTFRALAGKSHMHQAIFILVLLAYSMEYCNGMLANFKPICPMSYFLDGRPATLFQCHTVIPKLTGHM